MIARLWTGQVPLDRAEAYLRLMRQVALPDYRGTPGNLGAWCMHRNERAVVIVTMLTFWTDLDAIRRFAGSPEDTAKYYDFDSQFLVEMPDRVQHYSVAEA